MKEWYVYLSGEIHTDWRDQIAEGVAKAGLPVVLTSPVTDHSASDDCGVAILGEEDKNFWKDHKGAKINAIRTRSLIESGIWSSFGSVRPTSSGMQLSMPDLLRHSTLP